MQPSLDLQASVPLSDLLARDTFCARLAKYLLDRRGEWVDGRELQNIAGVYAWRTRVSDLRQAPWWLTIENRQRKVGDVTISEYKVL